jgi:hypothetical protein
VRRLRSPSRAPRVRPNAGHSRGGLSFSRPDRSGLTRATALLGGAIALGLAVGAPLASAAPGRVTVWPSGSTTNRATAPRSAVLSAATRVEDAASGQKGLHLFGVNIGVMSQLPRVTTLSSTLHRPYDIVGFYADWKTPFPTPRLQSIAAIGAVPSVTWEPWDHTQGGKQTTFSLRGIAAGTYDSYISSWAQGAAAWHAPLLIRLGHEMNGNWYSWGLGVNGNTAAEYVAAWRHVHDVFVRAHATNVLWVWSPNAVWGPTPALKALYPGSAYVNFLGIDGYNFGSGLPYGGWRSAQAILDPTLTDFDGFAASKPVLIAETASSEQGGSKSAWISAFVPYLTTRSQVAGFVWTEFAGSANWPLESSATPTPAMRAALAKWWAPPALKTSSLPRSSTAVRNWLNPPK